jgi:outer membrane protein assembly factor BamB
MLIKAKLFPRNLFALLIIVITLCSAAVAQTSQQLANEILTATGVHGGLVVHFGCGDGQLTAALRASDSYLVQGLDSSQANVEAARSYIKAQGLYGDVTAEVFGGSTLPYIENLVTLLVSENPLPFDSGEILRVLRPGGIAYIQDGNDWTLTTKPRPADIDTWTHYLHDASNNAVANDTVVGPPRRLQWMGSPKWSRQHDHMSSTTGFVSTEDKIFYIIDEGSKASVQLPSKWSLYARDAFNGAILWKKPIQSWMTQMWPFKSGPAVLPRRLVASGDRVYVTLTLDGAGLSALDAVTGDVIWTDTNSIMTEEILYTDGELFTVVKDNPPESGFNDYRIPYRATGDNKAYVKNNFAWDGTTRWVRATDANNGTMLWQYASPVAWLSLTADANGVYFHDGNGIVALNRTTGAKLWSSIPIPVMSTMQPNFGTTLVAYNGVLLFEGGDGDQTLTALNASTGDILWSDHHDKSRSNNQWDCLVVDDKAWVMDVAGGGGSGVSTGWDPVTGAVTSFAPDIDPDDTHWFHSRCYRAKATTNYLIPSRNGNEFVDPRAETWEIHHWVRGSCSYGFIPCNGLIYNPPHSCGCYLESKLFAFNAVAPAHPDPNYPQADSDGARLVQGPAYGEPLGASADNNDWPMYRCDPNRSGYSKAVVPAHIKQEWETSLDGELSAPVIANGKIYLAAKDLHTIYALDEADGSLDWSYVAGGRIDSPPTIYKGRVLFGASDGFLYCLRASDGALIWRFQAAPQNLNLIAYEQVESVWPLPGTVLVINDSIYCVAGRNVFLDGGLRFLQIDPVTGNKINEVVLDENDPNTGENLQVHIKGMNMPVAVMDILSSDGEYIYMKSQRFRMDGTREDIAPHSNNSAEQASVQYGKGMHLFAPTSLLDDNWFHRNYWVWGKSFAGGAGGWAQAGKYAPAGRIMSFNNDTVYGYGRLPEYFKWSTPLEYHLFSAEKYPESESITYNWSNTNVPILAKGMVLTDKILWIAGPEDVVDEEAAFDWWAMDPNDPNYDPNMSDKLDAQDAAFLDESGAKLRAVATWDGQTLTEYDLESVPVFDGVAAANGSLYIVTNSGKVKCFRGSNMPPQVDVGPDRNIFPMAAATLSATITDDGLPTTDPNDPNSAPVGISCSWSTVSGPNEVNFTDSNSADTTATFPTWGDYQLRLVSSDGSEIYADDLDVKVFRPADLDGDGDSDIDDIVLFTQRWLAGDCNEDNNWCLGADQDASGDVEMGSYDVMANNWLAGAIPAKPTGVTATGSDTQILIEWNGNTEPDLVGYNVYRSLTPGTGYSQLNIGLLTDSNFVDLSAAGILTYYYVVDAVDNHGYVSPYSAEKSASMGTQPGVKLIAAKGVTSDPNTLKVSNWNDQVNNNDAYQAYDINQPTYIASAINGQPAIEFDGTGQNLFVADSDQINKNGPFYEKTLIIVFQTSDNITSKQNIWEQGGNKAGGLNFYIQDANLYLNGWAFKDGPPDPNWGITADTVNTSIDVNTTYLATIVFNANTQVFEGFVNGASVGTYSPAFYLPTHSNDCAFGHTQKSSRFLSGGHSNAANFKGLIAEFYEFNDVLTPADLAALENYLLAKYGISP